MKINAYLIGLLFLCSLTLQAQKEITLADIWKNGTFQQKSIQNLNWAEDGQSYLELKGGKILKTNIQDPTKSEVLFDEKVAKTASGEAIRVQKFSLSADEKKILIGTASEPIYRRSSTEINYVFDRASQSLKLLVNAGKQMHASFSPDGKKVGFVRENNLYWVDLATGTEKAVTTTGKINALIHGVCDWVYEEEFSFSKAFAWSPDSKKIAFYTFDETQVPVYNMQMWGDLYPKDYRYKYPKAGEANSIVSLSIANIENNLTQKVAVGPIKDQYIPRMKWTKSSDVLAFIRLNRLQNHMELIHHQLSQAKETIVYEEKSDTSIEIESIGNDITYLNDQKNFIFTSEKSGFKHIYLREIASGKQQAITQGNWEVDDFYGFDEKTKTLYFNSTERTPIGRDVYQIQLNGSGKKLIAGTSGTNTATFSPDFSYYILTQSSAKSPSKFTLHNTKSGLMRVLEDNATLASQITEYGISPREFFEIPLANGDHLNGYVIKPSNFDPNKKYPVLMHVYGGPGSQQVLDTFPGADFYWYQMLLKKGYLIYCVDNRGTGARGVAFKKITYQNLGKIEVEDQIFAAKYLGGLPYIDASRIGIWGWSYGGFMSANCLMQGSSVFKAAISVAPVTNWRFYDSIYTERYQRTPQENPRGYDDNSPVNHVDKLKGNLLLVHGTGDDNVHFQNAVALEDALIHANKQFQSFYYPNRNHGIYGGNTRLHLYQMMTNFLEKNL
ncbi:S9 family peptidase [Aquirufa sp.]|jgi:dipeptidyl-peptidase-4|uniref:S9 family peptidase n=1 Tax=Aquirufa sp. TaxID=2676249 RepID=UPI0037C0B349